MPGNLKEIQELSNSEAIRNHGFPIDLRRIERMSPTLTGRPDLLSERKSFTATNVTVVATAGDNASCECAKNI